jgi:hypothetical protein
MGKTVGRLIGIIILVAATCATGAEAPTYDATGTWSYEISNGWEICPGVGIPPETGTVEIIQTGSTFTADYTDPPAPGLVSGSRYVGTLIEPDTGSATVTTITYNLTSSVKGAGHAAGVWSDGMTFCPYGADFTIEKISGTCIPSDTQLCLNEGRFAVTMDWEFQDARTGTGKAVPAGSDNSGILYFNNPSDWQLLVKVLDGCSVNNRYWVFFAATTDQQFTLTVTDTQTAQQVQYTNPLKQKANAVTDTSAFATCQ